MCRREAVPLRRGSAHAEQPDHRTLFITGADDLARPRARRGLPRLADWLGATPEVLRRLDAEPGRRRSAITLSIHPETFFEEGRTFHVLDTPDSPVPPSGLPCASRTARFPVSAATGRTTRRALPRPVADSRRPR
jgi:hypothetical protein